MKIHYKKEIEHLKNIIIKQQGYLSSGHKAELNELLGGSEKPGFLSMIKSFFASLFKMTEADYFIAHTLQREERNWEPLAALFGISKGSDEFKYLMTSSAGRRCHHMVHQLESQPIFQSPINQIKSLCQKGKWNKFDEAKKYFQIENCLIHLEKLSIYSHYPVFHAFFNQINQISADIDKLKKDSSSNVHELKRLEHELNTHRENLDKLIASMERLSPEDQKALSSSTESFQEESFLETREVYLQSLLPKKTTKEQSKLHLKELAEKRKKSPLTHKAIEKHAQLFDVSRETLKWAKNQSELTKTENTVNHVIKLMKSQEVFGFYKEGFGGTSAAGIMEKLMYDMALIMRDEDSFAETKTTELTTSKNQKRKGGIQVAIKGFTMSDYIKNKTPIKLSHEQFIKGTFSTVLYGMSDAHLGNMLVNENGFQFFDNTRSMPHSNELIRSCAGDNIIPYRSGLLYLDESYETLKEEDLELIKNMIIEKKEKMKQLREFVNSPHVQHQIQQLPPGWFDSEAALDAMQERLDRMEESLSQGTINCLRDLAFSAMPEFKFAAALSIVSDMILHKNKNITLNPTGIKNLQCKTFPSKSFQMHQVLLECIQVGMDPQIIRNLCQTPHLSFEEILSQSVDAYGNVKDKISQKELEQSCVKILSEIHKHYAIDLKDYPKKTILKLLDQWMTSNLATCESIIGKDYILDLNVNSKEIEEKKKNLEKDKFLLVTDRFQKSMTCRIYYYDKNDQLQERGLESTPVKNLVKIEGFKELINIADLDQIR